MDTRWQGSRGQRHTCLRVAAGWLYPIAFSPRHCKGQRPKREA
ncbi:hypothetical protein COLO4_31044 [Corchorus olitorius]|uniref:Uncharacterized protein n=1 Tax=Corchorus olitorius TaxID=93759 RepID=A0A1R3H5T3_9ROSI|nr:hypothetical protein COLO4_31044 [Corchorus olitorius]